MNNVECIHENLERNIDERHNNACYALINNSSPEMNIWRVFFFHGELMMGSLSLQEGLTCVMSSIIMKD